jgi:hypothetical protein
MIIILRSVKPIGTWLVQSNVVYTSGVESCLFRALLCTRAFGENFDAGLNLRVRKIYIIPRFGLVRWLLGIVIEYISECPKDVWFLGPI